MKKKISVCLATHNEERNIKRCLISVKDWVNEIIIIDGDSTDKTREIAKKLGAKVFKAQHRKMFHINKQMAIDKASSEWVLLLDADEEASSELCREIQTITLRDQKNSQSGSKITGYWIPRKNIIFNKWIQHTGWWPDHQLRFFKKGNLSFPCKSVHEDPVLNGESSKIKSPLIHYHYNSVSQYLKRLDAYTENDAKYLIQTKEKIRWQSAIIWPVDEFINRFLAQEGYKDGLHGLVLSLFQSFYRLTVFAKIWEKQKYWDKNLSNFDQKIFYILRHKLKEYKWWCLGINIKENNNPFKKVYLKIIRKLLNV